jgi:hypothetical protein
MGLVHFYEPLFLSMRHDSFPKTRSITGVSDPKHDLYSRVKRGVRKRLLTKEDSFPQDKNLATTADLVKLWLAGFLLFVGRSLAVCDAQLE